MAIINITNSNLSNDWQITGTPGADVLDGDIQYGTPGTVKYTKLYGGFGNDTYLIDATSTLSTIDGVFELPGGGIDTVTLFNYWNGASGYWAAASYSMPDNVENLNVLGQVSVVGGTAIAGIWQGGISDMVLGSVAIYGNALANNIATGTGNDTIYGGLGVDTMSGGTGNDTYYVDDAKDVVVESALPGGGSATLPGGTAGALGGNDSVISIATYTLSTGVENLYLDYAGGNINGTGNTLNNIIYGNAGNNNLQGLAGNDTIEGGGGKDTIAGGDGDDLIVNSLSYQAPPSVAFGAVTTAYYDPMQGATTTVGASAGSVLDGGTGNDTIWGSSGDTVLGGAGNDYLYGDLSTTPSEKITLSGGDGNDVFMNFGIGDSVSGGTGIDTVYANFTPWARAGYILAADVERAVQTATTAATIIGNVLDNYLQGNSGADSLVGGAGNDVLDGGAGADTMVGGEGADSYIVDNIGDVVVETGANSTVAGAADTVVFFGSGSFKSYTLGANVENLVLTDGNYVPSSSVTNANTLNGKGNALDNQIIGNANTNLLEGMAGNDTLNGGSGKDTLIGGSGNDVYYVDNSGDVIQELADYAVSGGPAASTVKGGIDTVFLANDTAVTVAGGINAFNGSGFVMTRNLENLDASGISAAAGPGYSTGFTITGNESANKIIGTLLDDTIIGGAGNDTMDGGKGNDVYYVSDAGDVATELLAASVGGGSADKVVFNASLLAVTFTLGNNIENLDIIGGSAGKFLGNALDNVMTGNGADNVIDGAVGNDRLYGFYGNDSLTGGVGNDLLNGGVGNDTMDGGAGNDTYIVDSASDKIVDSAGIDTIFTNLNSYDLSATIVGGGNSIENLNYHDVPQGVSGDSNFIGIGNVLNNAITGGGGNDTLDGKAGNDILDGGIGADLLKGGVGNDSYYVDNIGDVIKEDTTPGGGIDTVFSTIDFDLSSTVSGGAIATTVPGGQKSYVENLTLISTVLGGNAIYATGSELVNILTGNELDNVIDGGAGRNASGALVTSITGGADTMIGGDGNDVYFVDDIGDKITELGTSPTTVRGASFSANAGNADEIYATLADGKTFNMLTNALNVERLHILDNLDSVVGSSNTVNVIGNASDNIIWGGKGVNTIDGGDGSDIITGGAGNDTLIGGKGDDILNGDGLYQESVNGAWIDDTGGADSMSGGDGNDIFYVDLGDGAATVIGGANEDNVSGGAGIDTVRLLGGTIFNYTLNADVENLDLSRMSTGLTTTGRANALSNELTGLNSTTYNEVLIGGDLNDTFLLTPTSGSVDIIRGGLDSVFGGATSDNSQADSIYAKVDTTAGNVSANIDIKQIEAITLDVSNMSGTANSFAWAFTNFGDTTSGETNFGTSTVPGGIAPTFTITGGVTDGQSGSPDIASTTVTGNISLSGLSVAQPVTYLLSNYNQNNNLGVTTTLGFTDAGGSGDNLHVTLDNHKSGGLTVAGVETLFLVSTGDVLNNSALMNVLDVSGVQKTSTVMAAIDVTGDSSLQLRGLATGGIITLHDYAAQIFNLNLAGGGSTETINLTNVETRLTTQSANLATLNLVASNTLDGFGNVIDANNAALATTTNVSGSGNLTLNNFSGGNLNVNMTVNSELNLNALGSSNLTFAVTGGNGNVIANVAGSSIDSYAFGTSLNSSDFITDAGGSDTLSATLDGLDAGSGQLHIEGVETLDFSTTSSSGLIDGQFVSGATQLNLTTAAGTTLTVRNLDVATVFEGGSGSMAVYLDSLRAHTVTGGNNSDTIVGGDLSDTVTILAGNDFVATHGGSDVIDAGASLTSADTIDGGDGYDILTYLDTSGATDELAHVTNVEEIDLTNTSTSAVETTVDSLVGLNAVLVVDASSLTSGTLTWDGSAESTSVVGGNGVGNFNVIGGDANDTIIGGDGNDSIVGGSGQDSIIGGGGDDDITMLVTSGNIDIIDAGAGEDILRLSGATTVAAAVVDLSVTVPGGDQLTSVSNAAENLVQQGFENLDATGLTGFGVIVTAAVGGSYVEGSGLADTITGGIGVDWLSGNGGADSISGGAGDDTIGGGTGVDTISGDAGNDVINMLVSNGNTDAIDAGLGIDTLVLTGAGTANMTVDLSASDQFTGSGGDSAIQQGFENLDASGITNARTVTVTAASGGSNIIGTKNADTIKSGIGADTMTGGAGGDHFEFGVTPVSGNVDTITDFTSGTDVIDLYHIKFEMITTIAGGTLSAAEFTSGAGLKSSSTAGTVIVYDTSSGGLYYDADGNGTGSGELIAILGNAPWLLASDIFIA